MARQIKERWIDYSAAKLTGVAIRDAGFTGAVRYIEDLTNPKLLKSKHTNKAEYDSLVKAGVKVMLVFEVSISDPDGGFAQGVAYARRAKAGADVLGYKGVIFFCNDRPGTPDAASWRAYLQGAASVLGKSRVGAYGFAGALDLAQGYASAFWQAGRQSDLRDHAGIYQWNNGRVYVSGIECDLNYVYTDYTVQTSGGGSASGSTIKDEDDMAVQAKAAADDFVSVPCNGKSNLYIGTHYGRRVKILGCTGIGPTKEGGDYKSIPIADFVDADRPGPIPVPAGVVTVSLRYSADHEFTAWCA